MQSNMEIRISVAIPDIGRIADISVTRTPNHVAIVRNVKFNTIGQMSLYAIRLFGLRGPPMLKTLTRLDSRAPNGIDLGFHTFGPEGQMFGSTSNHQSMGSADSIGRPAGKEALRAACGGLFSCRQDPSAARRPAT
jgi:hypothetical protein